MCPNYLRISVPDPDPNPDPEPPDFKSFLASHLWIHQSKVWIWDPEKTYSEKKHIPDPGVK
jgi:hypothetical protein